MRFTVDHKDFQRIINLAATPIRAGVTALECVRIAASDNRIVASGTNGQTEVRATCEAAVSEAGETHVNAADLRAVVQRMRGVIDASGDLLLSSGGAKITLPTLSVTQPKMAAPIDEVEIEGGIETYLACVPFAATSEVQWHLRGVAFCDGFAVATDGQGFFASKSSGSGQIVPSEAHSIIKKVGGRLFLGNLTWRAESEGVQALGSIIDHPGTNWQRILLEPDAFTEVDADALTGAIEAVTVGRGAWTHFAASDEGYTVSGGNFSGLHIEGEYFVSCKGAMTFVADTKLVLKALAPFEGQTIRISTNGSGLRIDGDGDGFAQFMALRDARTKLEAAA